MADDDFSTGNDYGGLGATSQADYLKELQRRNLDPGVIQDRMFQNFQRPALENYRDGNYSNSGQMFQGLTYGQSGLDPGLADERSFRTFTPPAQWYTNSGPANPAPAQPTAQLGQAPQPEQPETNQQAGGRGNQQNQLGQRTAGLGQWRRAPWEQRQWPQGY
ncbi:MAG: hypothetical protein HQK56_06540 [Deltaproteobacteria bacterium]|nr:hypothetical protein [Deltaproteobacteria bacterium]